MDFIVKSFHETKTRLGDAFGEPKAGIENSVNNVASKTKSMTDNVGESINNVASKTKSMTDNVGESINNVASKTKSMTDNVGEIINNVASKTKSMTDEEIRSLPSNQSPTEMEKIGTTVSGFFMNNWMSMLFWSGIVILVAFLGFNVFEYIGDMVDFFKRLSSPILELGSETVKQTADVTATGTKGLIDASSKTAIGGIDLLQDKLKHSSNDIDNYDKESEESEESDDDEERNDGNIVKSNNKDVNTRENDKIDKNMNSSKEYDPLPIETTENTSTKGMTGYCYIGTEKGIRTCARVGRDNVCMSGDIFPTREVCMNPKLRA